VRERAAHDVLQKEWLLDRTNTDNYSKPRRAGWVRHAVCALVFAASTIPFTLSLKRREVSGCTCAEMPKSPNGHLCPTRCLDEVHASRDAIVSCMASKTAPLQPNSPDPRHGRGLMPHPHTLRECAAAPAAQNSRTFSTQMQIHVSPQANHLSWTQICFSLTHQAHFLLLHGLVICHRYELDARVCQVPAQAEERPWVMQKPHSCRIAENSASQNRRTRKRGSPQSSTAAPGTSRPRAAAASSMQLQSQAVK